MTRIVRDAIDAALRQSHNGLPARVEAYDRAAGTVDAQPLLLRRFRLTDGSESVVPLPLIESVPLLYPVGGGWSITWPMAVGDMVHLAFADRSLDAWKAAGAGELVDPLDARQHDLSDAIALPGLRQPGRPSGALGDALRIGREDRSAEIEVSPDGTITLKSGRILLGGPAAIGSAVRGEPLEILLSAIAGAVGAITGSGAAAGTAITAAINTAKAAGLFNSGVRS